MMDDGWRLSTQTSHTNMNLGFSEPDIHDELQFGNNMPYVLPLTGKRFNWFVKLMTTS